MKKTLYTIGDSWTQGYDLKNPKEECYPYLLSKKLDCDLINEAKPAASNDWMFRKSVEWITTNDTSNIHTFIVGWSQPDRREENFNFYHGGAPKYERINYADNTISNWISKLREHKYIDVEYEPHRRIFIPRVQNEKKDNTQDTSF